MTRGRQAERSRARQDAAQTDQTVAGYQRAVQRLAAERDSARQELATLRRTTVSEIRRLRAERDEGLSAELIARDVIIAQLKEDHARERAWNDKVRRQWDRVTSWWMNHAQTDHGLGVDDAVDALMALVSEDGRTPMIAPAGATKNSVRGLGVDQLQSLGVRKGHRKPGGADRASLIADVGVITSEVTDINGTNIA